MLYHFNIFKSCVDFENQFFNFYFQDISIAPNDLSSSDEEPTKILNDKVAPPKSTLKPKLSNTSSKSGDEGSLQFDLPEHLKATATNDNETIVEENENVISSTAKKQKKSKKSKEKKHHKKRKSIDKERDELEEFLNGIPPTNIQTDVGAYEEL